MLYPFFAFLFGSFYKTYTPVSVDCGIKGTHSTFLVNRNATFKFLREKKKKNEKEVFQKFNEIIAIRMLVCSDFFYCLFYTSYGNLVVCLMFYFVFHPCTRSPPICTFFFFFFLKPPKQSNSSRTTEKKKKKKKKKRK